MKQRIEVRCLFVFLVILLFSCLGRADLLFDQSPTGYSQLYNCMYDEVNFFWCRIADDFSVPYAANIDSLVWWGGYWPLNSGNTNDFWIEIYPDSSGFNQPQQASIYSQKVAFAESSLAPPDNYYIYGATIPSFLADSGVIYWIQFMAGLVYPPFWGNNGSTIWGNGLEFYLKSDYFGWSQWVSATTAIGEPFETSFQIYGAPAGIQENEKRGPEIPDWELIAFPNPFFGKIELRLHRPSENGSIGEEACIRF